MTSPTQFIRDYAPQDRGSIAFAWNGKHAEEFFDSNASFRRSVIEACLASPTQAPSTLLEDLFLAESCWAREAWGSPRDFAQLGQTLLERGEADAIPAFSKGFMASFDTFCACHEIALAPDLIIKLTVATRVLLENPANDERTKGCLESTLERLGKMQVGTAPQGWFALRAGTEASKIRIVGPSWYARLWGWLTR